MTYKAKTFFRALDLLANIFVIVSLTKTWGVQPKAFIQAQTNKLRLHK